MTDALYISVYFINTMNNNKDSIADNRHLSELIFDRSDDYLAEAVNDWCYIDFAKTNAED